MLGWPHTDGQFEIDLDGLGNITAGQGFVIAMDISPRSERLLATTDWLTLDSHEAQVLYRIVNGAGSPTLVEF
jgi:hypothetical protein